MVLHIRLILDTPPTETFGQPYRQLDGQWWGLFFRLVSLRGKGGVTRNYLPYIGS